MHSIIFFGDDQYSAIVLKALLASATITVSAVVTTTGKPQGRKAEIIPNKVEEIAKESKLNILYYPDNKEDLSKFIANLQDSIKPSPKTTGALASFGKILPQNLIELFGNNGILCLHPSLLPQYRGATPGQYALALGDTTTGITLFQLTSKVDEGEILAQVEDAILPTDTTPTLLSRLFTLGSVLLINYLLSGNQTLRDSGLPSSPSSPSYLNSLLLTRKFSRATGFVEWTAFMKMIKGDKLTLEDTLSPLLQLRLINALKSPKISSHTYLADLLRALTPWPGVWTTAPTTKGDMRISLESVSPTVTIKLAGKPNPIAFDEFAKYYL